MPKYVWHTAGLLHFWERVAGKSFKFQSILITGVKDIDLIHLRISSIAALKLERFTKLEVSLPIFFKGSIDLHPWFAQRLCLRQNQISRINLPSSLGATLKELDLYDNLISHIKGLEDLVNLTLLDLSFNKIKHIKNVSHLTKLTDIFFVQNRISTIEGLEELVHLRNLELGGNRIRVCYFRERAGGEKTCWT